MGDLIGFAFGVHVQNLMETILIGIWDQGISVDIGCILAVINYKKVIIDPIGLWGVLTGEALLGIGI